jgi:serine/threonine protein phosphatase 1
LKSLNYNYTVSKRKRNIKEICGKQLISSINVHYEFHIDADSSKEITDYISEKIKIPTWVYELSQRQFDIFLQTLILGNGTTYNRINTTTSILYGLEESLKNIQGVCATKGYTATLVHDNRGDPRLNICKCSTIQFDSSKVVSTEHYNGKVWCIVTPLTNFMVRQNGTHFFTGNCWALHWMKTGVELPVWWHQGGMRTAESYDFDYENVPKSHMKFLEDMIPYYKDEQNRVFVHGGFIPDKPIEEQDIDILTWDRELMCAYAPKGEIPGYKHVFVGHTTTQHFGRDYKIPDCMVPLTFHNLTAMDTGGGWNGRLSMMDVDTFEYWQSEFNANMQNTMKRLDGLQFK